MKILRFVLVLALAANFLSPARVHATNGFQAGRIIDDGLFFTGPSLPPDTIQQFLNSKVPTCDTNGAQTYSGSTTRGTYGASRGYPPPYTCLKDYRTDSAAKPAETGLCDQYAGGTNQTAAEIIYNVSLACGVSDKVLLVLLQKEQSLVTDDWPWPVQYQKAAGYGCPDTAPCDPAFAGFANQVYYAARQFRRYIRDANSFSYRVGRENYIQYNPAASCRGANVFLYTNATAALYNYTPYQPNAAALNNLYGSGDSCSTYGNRNFWRLYNDWFGATTSDSDTDVLSFIRLNHSSGRVEDLGYPSIGSYQYAGRSSLTSYPAVAPDGNVVPLLWPNGDLVFLRLNHSSGHTELVSYSAASGYQHLVNYQLTNYPAIGADKAVVPLFRPNGDLSFIRLNHSSGRVEVVTYSAASGFHQLIDYKLASYPAVAGDGNVVPLFWPNGDLVFIRLNHSSGKIELVSYSAASGYQQLANYKLIPYPSVANDGAVIPLFKPNGDLSFIRLNHSSGRVEVVSYSATSQYQQLSEARLTGYPAMSPDGSIIPIFSR